MIAGILCTILILGVLFAAQGVYRNWDVYRGHSTRYDALPLHLDEESEIEAAFPDDSQYTGFFGKIYRKFHKITKPWGAFGPRSKFAWARWRNNPVTVLAIGGKGPWRGESDYAGERTGNEGNWIGWHDMAPYYLSRIQYWKRWHLAINWPLQVTFHIYWRAEDVPVYPNHPKDTTIKDMVFGYGPIHRDADRVYWLLSFFFGGAWK